MGRRNPRGLVTTSVRTPRGNHGVRDGHRGMGSFGEDHVRRQSDFWSSPDPYSSGVRRWVSSTLREGPWTGFQMDDVTCGVRSPDMILEDRWGRRGMDGRPTLGVLRSTTCFGRRRPGVGVGRRTRGGGEQLGREGLNVVPPSFV